MNLGNFDIPIYSITFGSSSEEQLKEGIAFSEIYKQQNRKTCVVLPYLGIKKALKEYKDKHE